MRTILITGASSGIGKALAQEYAGLGTILILLGRNKERLNEVSRLCQEKGSIIITSEIEVTDRERMEKFINDIDRSSPIDLVISNAGISAGTGGGEETADQARRIFSVNVDGVFNTIFPVIALMKKRKTGQVAIMSSMAGFRGLPGAPAYSASKGAVRIYGEALRGYLKKDGIKVSVICPGYIKTPMTDINEFPMPFLMSAEKAAAIIKKGLERNKSRIAFPFPFYFFVWLISCFSPRLTDPLFARLPTKK